MAERRLRWTRTVVVEGPASWVLGTRARSLTVHPNPSNIRHVDERLEQEGVGGWEVVAVPPQRVPEAPNYSVPALPIVGGEER